MRSSPVYYGWFVLAASAVCEMLIQGATLYGAPLFVIPLQDEFHISRAAAGSATSFLIIGALVMAPGIGRLLDTKPVRLIMSAGAVTLGLSLTAIALTHSLLAIALILLVPMAVAFMCLGSLNTSTLASRWFTRNRGLALGIAAVATSGGSFTVVPLLSIAIQRYGWREALLYEGIAIAAVIICLAALILRDRPSDLGLEDHPENLVPGSAPAVTKAGPVRWKAVFASRAFWIPSLVLAAVSGTCQAIVVTLYPYSVKQLGFPVGQATLLISAFGIAAATAKILAGVLADHVNQRFLLIAAAAFMTVSWLVLSLSADYGALLASSAFAGCALGCALPTTGGMIAGSFGANNFGRVMSWTYVLTGVVAVVAPYFAGFMFDRSGGYHAAFECFAAMLAVLLLLTVLVPPGACNREIMTVAGLIAELEGRSILLSLDGEQIRYRSPKQALTDADRDALRARRGDIVDYLKARNAARGLRGTTPTTGPLMPSVAQEMWRAFAGGAEEGKPIALNIGMVGRFRAAPEAVTAAIRQMIARYDALRARFEARDGALLAFLNPAEAFEIGQEDLRGMGTDAAREAANKGAQQFCGLLNPIEGTWLTRARVFALPDGESLAAMSSAHMIADAGTRNILLDEIHDILETGAPRAPSPVLYNDYCLAERDFLAGEQGAQLIEHWRRWYHDQPTMQAPSDNTPLVWGNGIRIVKNFTIPGRIANKVRDLAASLKVTPFLIYLTIFSIAMARWAKMERFAVRVLGDKRISLELTNTVGLMFCADAVEISVPAAADFEAVMRGILTEYDATLSLRIPTLHFWAPHCVRPGIEDPDYPNKIPAVFNYYSLGTAREKAERRSGNDTGASLPWPPDIVTLTQTWPRRSSPLFLHVMDYGHEVQVSLHFFQGVISPADQDSFTAMLFRVFAEVVLV